MSIESRFDSNCLIDNRQIRIFLSSTFSDMQAERTALVKTFEKLKIEANRRNVTLSVIDLRWGVTEEEARSGKVISVCLNEIEHSHPFFIGLLGSHYGTSLDLAELTKNPDLKERYPWIEKDLADGLSITEMEIQYGVLRNNANVNAAFYIRQCNTLDDNPKLSILKKKIRDQKQYPVEDYTTIENLCAKVENEVLRLLNHHFPEKEITLLDRERSFQRAYINSRHSLYIKRQSYFDIIDTFIRSDEQHLVFTGESGMGKSALLANWIKENESCKDFNLVYHFLDNSFASNSYENILRHLCDEIYNLYAIEKESIRNEKIEEEAQRLVNIIAIQETPLIIVIDGINQISTVADEKLLLWLPVANNNVKYLFTTLRGDDTMRTFERRGYKIETITPLNEKERECFVVDYLANVGKHLNDNQLRRIVSDSECENTLVLKTLLDELICFGSYKRLDNRIEYYLAASSISEFFDRVLQRLEEDYSANQDLVRNALTLIALSEHGLSEDELVTILECRQLDWHLFFCAIYNHIIVKNGLVTFTHQYLSEAVAKRYNVENVTSTTFFRRKIINHFFSLYADSQTDTNRCISELAHQYYHLSDWPKLYNTIMSFDAFRYYYDTDKPLLALYWRKLTNVNDGLYSLESYLNIKENIDGAALGCLYNNIADFIRTFISNTSLSISYNLKALEVLKNYWGKEQSDIGDSYYGIGVAYYAQANYQEALKYFQSALDLVVRVVGPEHIYTAACYSSIGITYQALGDYPRALEFLLKCLEIEKNNGKEHFSIATTYHNIGHLYMDLGEYSKSSEFFFKALELMSNNHPNIVNLYNGIGYMYDKQGNYPKALEFCNKGLETAEKLVGLYHYSTAQSYGNIAAVYDDKSEHQKALDNYFKALGILIKVVGETHPYTASIYTNIGIVYEKQGRYSDALNCYFKALEILKRVVDINHPEIATVYNNIGCAYDSQGKYKEALEQYYKALEIRERVLGIMHPDTALSYNNIGFAYYNQGKYDEALKWYFKALKVREEMLGTQHPDTENSYNNIGTVYHQQNEYRKSLEYQLKSLEIRKKILGLNHPDTALSYNNIGTLYYNLGEFDKALEFFERALQICIGLFGTEHSNVLSIKEWIFATKIQQKKQSVWKWIKG